MQLLQIILISVVVTSMTQGMKVLMCSGCFWDEVGPNLAVAEELLFRGFEVVYASPAECNTWIDEYPSIKKLDTDGPGDSDLKTRIQEYEIETGNGYEAFYEYEADLYLSHRYTDMYEAIHEYLANDSVDVMFVTFNAIGALLAAEMKGTPVLVNYNSLVMTTLTEHCSNCGYTKALPRLYYSGTCQLNLVQEFVVSVLWNVAPLWMWRRDAIINSKRQEIGLSSYFPKSATLNLEAIYPKVYSSLNPVLLEEVRPPEGRWVVGPLVPKSTGREVSSELEEFLRVSSKPVALVSIGDVLELSGSELHSLLSELRGYTDYRVIWLQERLEQIEADNVLIEHPIFGRELMRDERIDLVVVIAGYSSIAEACVHKKPMILIPVLSEQKKSASLMEELGCSETVSVSDISHLPSLIEFMLSHSEDYSDCLQRIQRGSRATRGARHVTEILEKMASSGYHGMDVSSHKSSVPDIIHSLLAIVLLLLQGALILLLTSLVLIHALSKYWANTGDVSQKDKQD